MDLCKIVQKQKIRRKLTPYRVRNRRVQLEALHTLADHIIGDPEVAGETLRAECAAAFAARHWAWSRGELSAVVAKLGRSAQCPDGVAYQVWGLGDQELD